MSIQEAAALVYPDEYIVEQDEMGISAAQTTAVRHAVNVLEPVYEEKYALQSTPLPPPTWISTELNHYHEAVENSKKLIVPDIAVFEGIDVPVVLQETLSSWDMRVPGHPPPPLVIEICSPETYDGDILPDKKPRLYGLIGVREYFAYDPNQPRVWPLRGPNRVEAGVRLLGWHYDVNGAPSPIQPATEAGRKGWLWSEVLQHWLVPNEKLLEFYTAEGVRRLDRGEIARQAHQQAREAEQTARREAQARHEAEQIAQQEAQARQQAERARQEAEQRESQAAQQLADLQRQLEEMRRRLGEQ